MLKALFVGIGGFIGAVTRFGIVKLFGSYFPNFPWGTFVANFIGSLLIGFLLYSFSQGKTLAGIWQEFLIVGFLGSLTTMSSFTYETFRLFDLKYIALAFGNLFITLIFCFLAIYLGKKMAIWMF